MQQQNVLYAYLTLWINYARYSRTKEIGTMFFRDLNFVKY